MADAKADLPPVLQWAYFYHDAGFSIIPTAEGEKRPGLKSWQEWERQRPSKEQLRLWFTGLYRNCGLGMVTGAVSGNVLVVDPDAGEGKEGLENLDDVLMMHDDFPETWTSKTGGGGRHHFFRAPEGVRIRTGSDVIARHVDVRGEGGFLVLPPSLHPCGRMYEWVPGLDPGTTKIAACPAWLLPMVSEGNGEAAGLRGRAPGPPPGSRPFNEWGTRIDGREAYMRDLLWARLLEERRKCPLPLDDALLEEILQETWEVFERKVKARGASLAADGRGIEEMRRKLKYAARKWDTKIADAAKEEKPNSSSERSEKYSGDYSEEPKKPANPPPPLAVAPAFPIDPMTIPTRPWLIPGLLIRNHVTVLGAPAGVGKSLLTLQVALMLGANMQWSNWEPRQACRVLVINSEDDTDEMRRRLVSAARVMNISQETLADRIYLAESPETIVIARTDPKTKAVIRQPLVDQIIATVRELKVDCIVVDPFAETFEGDENSNSELKWAAVLWREIARQTGSAVFLVHHTRKYAQGMMGDADALRGASALVGVARVVQTLFNMSEDEAALFNVPLDERHRYVRLDSAKANLSLVTFNARWFEKLSELVGNGGDEVGVLRPWAPPGLFENISSVTVNRCLDLIDAGLMDDDGRPTGELWTQARQASRRWVGIVVQTSLGCDEERAARIVRTWVTSGLLVEKEFYDGKQTRKGLKVDQTKRPGVAA